MDCGRATPKYQQRMDRKRETSEDAEICSTMWAYVFWCACLNLNACRHPMLAGMGWSLKDTPLRSSFRETQASYWWLCSLFPHTAELNQLQLSGRKISVSLSQDNSHLTSIALLQSSRLFSPQSCVCIVSMFLRISPE